MPWDTGTRDESVPLWEAAARDMKEIGADGLNGDTINGIGQEFRKASDDSGHILALEPENNMANPAILAWNNLSWGYWQYNRPVPVVSRYKWVEPRHMVNVCERWAKDRTDGLQSAFFNGVGYESWENVWGIWNQLTLRDAEALRRISAIERAMAELLVSPDWQPHVQPLQAGVYASRFPGQGARSGCWSTARTAISRATRSSSPSEGRPAATTCGTASNSSRPCKATLRPWLLRSKPEAMGRCWR